MYSPFAIVEHYREIVGKSKIKVLDLGCGTNPRLLFDKFYNSENDLNLELTGIDNLWYFNSKGDFSAEVYAEAHMKRITLIKGDIFKIEVTQFNVIFIVAPTSYLPEPHIFHIESDEPFYRQSIKYLEDNGIIVIVPLFEEFKKGYFSKETLEALCEEFSLSVKTINIECFDFSKFHYSDFAYLIGKNSVVDKF